MRFIRRNAPEKPQATTADDVLQLGDHRLPVKAETILGAKNKLGRRKTNDKKQSQRDTFEHVPSDQQRSLGTLLRAQEALLDTQEALLENMPINRYPSIWPNVEVQNRSDISLLHPSRRPGIPPRKASSNATPRRVEPRADLAFDGLFEPIDREFEYYDPSSQPSYVSQQTSASAVRDMGLRKGAPMIHETSSDPTLVRRPLKSAMKKLQPEARRRPEELARIRTNSSEKKPKKLDLSQYFPQPRAAAARVLSPTKLSQSPSTITDVSESFPPQTVRAQLRRPSANGRFETLKSGKPASIDSGSTTRVKIFEPDVFDRAKTNVRRPPKGIQNWFDGFDISSDEEPEPEPQELPANEALPSTFTPWSPALREPPKLNRKASKDPVEDNMLAIEHAKGRMQERLRMAAQRKNSVDSVTLHTVNSVVSSPVASRKNGGESRLATSRLANESVLSLSSSSSDEIDNSHLPPIRDSVEASSVVFGNTNPLAAQRPSIPPRQLHNKRSMPRESNPRQSASTMQTSGSIPITLSHDSPMPDIANRVTQTSSIDPTERALRQLTGERDSRSQPSRSRRTTKASQDFEGSVGGETASSMPTDTSHTMAVTEEEMILLEMMRKKRAAMQKDSFAEGYHLALLREQEHLARRRASAQQTAMKILRQKDERAAAKSHRSSRIEGVVDEELEQRRKFSAVRKEEVDKALKLERFLRGGEIPVEDAFPDPPAADRAPKEASSAAHRFELLLPDTYSPAPSRDPISAGDSSSLRDEDLEDHHDKIRAFLASSSATEGASAFPTPPSSKPRTESRRDKRKSMMSPSPVAEEEPTAPTLPPRSPRRVSPTSKDDRRQPITGRRLSSQIDIEALIDSASALPGANRHAHDYNPDNLLPSLDFSPLEFPSRSMAGAASPSLSTSRTSPLTPTFTATAPSDKNTVDFASSDNASIRGRAYTPDTDLTSLSASLRTNLSPTSGRRHQQSKPLPPRLDTLANAGFDQRLSMTSITSAGEDVLAAWKELGGGSETLAPRRLRVR